MHHDLRAPKRVIAKPRDHFLPILLVVVLIGATAVFLLHRLPQQNPDDAPRRGNSVGTPPQRMPTRERSPTFAETPQEHTGPAMDCGLVNGVRRCFPRSNIVPQADVPTAADEFNRAIAIMEDGARRRSSLQRPSRRSRWMTADDLLAAAEQSCASARNEGTIAYRQCRANQWQHLRKSCIDLRGRLNMADAEHADQLRAETDAYCVAEQRYHIIK